MSLLRFGHLTATSKDARDKILQALQTLADYSLDEEPGVLNFCITVPVDTSDEKSIYVIEEFADQAAYDELITKQPAQDVFKLFESTPSPLSCPPAVTQLSIVTSFTRPQVSIVEEPTIWVTLFGAGNTDPLLGLLEAAGRVEKSEPDVLGFAVLKDDKEDELWIMETSPGAAPKVKGAKSDTGTKRFKLRKKEGWISNEPSSAGVKKLS